MQHYAALKFNLYFVLENSCGHWHLYTLLMGPDMYIQLTFDSYIMGHFESYHIDKHRIRNLLVLVAWKSVEK